MKFEEIIVLITLVVFFVIIIVIAFIVIQQRRFIRLENEKKSLEKIQEIRLAEAMIKSQ
jgi:cytoskeletal protein RodZ